MTFSFHTGSNDTIGGHVQPRRPGISPFLSRSSFFHPCQLSSPPWRPCFYHAARGHRVAISLQNFSANPEEKFGRRREKKFCSPVISNFE
jgi:hypothetical protein